jgi:Transglycosylase SLT domain
MTRNTTLGLVTAGAMFICGLLALVTIFGGGDSGAGTTGACNQIGVTATGQPPLTEYYLAAAKRFKLGNTGYAYLAAINDVETTFGTNLAVSSAGAIGWMQFEPATFKQYAISVSDPTQPADPDDPQDAIYTAANLLSANGAPRAWSAAIYDYNHASWYVQEVERKAASFEGVSGEKALANAIADAWGGRTQPAWDTPATVEVSYGADQQQVDGACSRVVADITPTVAPVPGAAAIIMPSGLARPPQGAPTRVQEMIDAGDRITGFDYQWGGGHADPAQSDSQTNPQPQGGTEPGQNGTPGYDCSGSTDYVLWGAGYGQSILSGSDPASGGLMHLGDPGNGKWVTWYAQAGHVFIEIAGIVFDTVPGPTTIEPAGAPTTGPRWATSSQITYEFTYDGAFVPRHPKGL